MKYLAIMAAIIFSMVLVLVIYVAQPKQLSDLTPQQMQSREEFLKEAVAVFPPFAPLQDVPTISMESADELLNPEELVVGVAVNGESKAFPLNMIDAPERKVINDELGGASILVTWCDQCHTAAVFQRTVDGAPELFGCSGMLWQGTLVMYDALTESFWNHLLGECVAGKRLGMQLTAIPSVITTWDAWKASYPQTTVLSANRVTQVLDRDYYQEQMDPASIVFAIRGSETTLAWTLDFLRSKNVIHVNSGEAPFVVFCTPDYSVRAFQAKLDDQNLTFKVVAGRFVDEQTMSDWSPISGKALSGSLKGRHLVPVAGLTGFAASWDVFYPGTQLNQSL